DSLALLAQVRELIEKQGYSVGNVSAAIVAQRPRLAPYIAQMKQNLANVLHIFEQNVGISAGTNEGLGYLGRGEGITVTATVLFRADGLKEQQCIFPPRFIALARPARRSGHRARLFQCGQDTAHTHLPPKGRRFFLYRSDIAL